MKKNHTNSAKVEEVVPEIVFLGGVSEEGDHYISCPHCSERIYEYYIEEIKETLRSNKN